MEITAKITKDGNVMEGKIDYNVGTTISEATELFGAEAVFDTYERGAVLKIQAAMRVALAAGKDLNEVFSNWKLDTKAERTKKDALEVAKSKFAKMSQEDRLAFLNQLQALA